MLLAHIFNQIIVRMLIVHRIDVCKRLRLTELFGSEFLGLTDYRILHALVGSS